MNKKAKAKELTIGGFIVFCVMLIFIGSYMVNVGNEQSTQETKSFMLSLGWLFLAIGVIGIIVLIVAGIILIAKHTGAL